MPQDQAYDKHLDNLLALTTYLALTKWRSRTPNALSRDLGLKETSITATLDGFPGLFRKSHSTYGTDEGPQFPYTLHARYAQRRTRTIHQSTIVPPTETDSRASLPEPGSKQDGTGEELSAEIMRALLDFITEQARAERESHQERVSRRTLLVIASVAAFASIAAAIISLLKPGIGSLNIPRQVWPDSELPDLQRPGHSSPRYRPLRARNRSRPADRLGATTVRLAARAPSHRLGCTTNRGTSEPV